MLLAFRAVSRVLIRPVAAPLEWYLSSTTRDGGPSVLVDQRLVIANYLTFFPGRLRLDRQDILK